MLLYFGAAFFSRYRKFEQIILRVISNDFALGMGVGDRAHTKSRDTTRFSLGVIGVHIPLTLSRHGEITFFMVFLLRFHDFALQTTWLFRNLQSVFWFGYLYFLLSNYVIFCRFHFLALILQVLVLLLLGDDLLNLVELFAVIELFFQVLRLLGTGHLFLLVGFDLSR